MKKLLVAGLMVVLASPAFAAIQNVKVSGDITTSWVYQNSLNLGTTDTTEGLAPYATSGTGVVGDKHQNVFVTQTRLRVDADLSDNVSTEVGLINERAWNAEYSPAGSSSTTVANLDTNVQLYLATLTLREFLYSPLTLTIGRQAFNFGNGLILGNGGPSNIGGGNLLYIDQDLTERTAYDGVTATLDYKPLTISMIYFKNQQNVLNGTPNADQSSSDVLGYNANYQLSDPWSTVVEQYVFARMDGHNNGAAFDAPSNIGTTSTDKPDTMYVPGLRASTNPTKSLNLQGEVAWELGNHPVVGTTSVQQSEHRDAMAAQALASYTLPVLEKYKPSVNASYTYVSGDKNATQDYAGDHVSSAKTFSAWDEFNSIQGAGTIYRSIFPMSNEHIVSVGASANPLEDVTAAVTWSGLWAATSFSSSENALTLYQPNGTTITPATNGRGTWEGNETDVNLTYNYTEDVTFGLSLGWFVPGDVFTANNHDTASQAIANVAVTF